MKRQNSILGKSIIQAAIGLFIFGALLFLFWLMVLGLEKIGISLTIYKTDLNLILIVFVIITLVCLLSLWLGLLSGKQL